MKGRKLSATSPEAIELIEEAVTSLRATPPSAWAIYLSAAVPWVLAFGYFWASASWFAPRPAELLWQALALTTLYLTLKLAQAEFCARLRAVRLRRPPVAPSWSGLRRTAARQARSHGWAAPILPIAAVLSVPLGVAWMYFENLTALAATADPEGKSLKTRARREAMRWPGLAHLCLLLFSGLWLCVWLNIASAFYLLPWLGRTLLGLDTAFGLSGWSFLNDTFLAPVSILAWLAVEPLVKSYHVLRTFYGEARENGEDSRLSLGESALTNTSTKAVRTELHPGASSAALLRVVTLGLSLLWLAEWGGDGGLRANEITSPAYRIEDPTTRLDQAVDAVLADRNFRWRLARPPKTDADEVESGLKLFVRQGLETVKDLMHAAIEFAQDFAAWLDGLFKKKDNENRWPRNDPIGAT